MNDPNFRRRRLWAGSIVLVLIAGLVSLISRPGGGPRGPASFVGAGRPGGGLIRGATQTVAGDGRGAAQTRAAETVLAYTGYLTTGSPRRREIALTFDDGPGPSTLKILAVLHRARAPATFFEIGRATREYPAIERRVLAAGLPIGDHTETHALLSHLSPSAQAAEIGQAAVDIQRQGAPYPRLFRPPYGAFNPDTLGVTRRLGMLMVLWTVDTKDFSRPGVKRIIYTAVSGARPGATILFHDGGGDRSQTAAALPRIITLLRRRHYQLVTVTRLLLDDPPPRGQPPPHSLSGG